MKQVFYSTGVLRESRNSPYDERVFLYVGYDSVSAAINALVNKYKGKHVTLVISVREEQEPNHENA